MKFINNSYDLSKYLDTPIKKNIQIKDISIDSRTIKKDSLFIAINGENFNGNEGFIKVVKSSAFCSENNEIISDNYKITKDQKIGIIPPIGGG